MPTRSACEKQVRPSVAPLVLAVTLTLAVAAGAAPTTTPQPAPTPVPRSSPAPSLPPRVPVALAPKSQLPLPSNAELWIDSIGSPMLTLPGVPANAVQKMRIAVFHPRGDRLAWTDFTGFYASQGLIAPAVKPLEVIFTPALQGPLTEENGNLEEIKVFGTTAPGDHLVLGSVRNLVTQAQLGYVAVVSGKLGNPDAMVAGRTLVNLLIAQERARRAAPAAGMPTPPVPPGATLVGAVDRIQGPQLQQLLQAIVSGAQVPARVKQMAQVVLPQATAVVLSSFQMPTPMTDEQLVEFFTREAEKKGWGPPVSTDTTQAGSPTMLFQLPSGAGVAMIRCITATTPAILTPRKSQSLHYLVMEGKINVSALKTSAAPAGDKK